MLWHGSFSCSAFLFDELSKPSEDVENETLSVQGH